MDPIPAHSHSGPAHPNFPRSRPPRIGWFEFEWLGQKFYIQLFSLVCSFGKAASLVVHFSSAGRRVRLLRGRPGRPGSMGGCCGRLLHLVYGLVYVLTIKTKHRRPTGLPLRPVIACGCFALSTQPRGQGTRDRARTRRRRRRRHTEPSDNHLLLHLLLLPFAAQYTTRPYSSSRRVRRRGGLGGGVFPFCFLFVMWQS